MQTLMNMITPFSELPNRYRDMYFRGNKIFCGEDNITVYRGGILSTDTYFNGLSIRKWRKYTEINDLFLKIDLEGDCAVYVRNDYRAEYLICTQALAKENVSGGRKEIVIDLTKYIDCDGMISFEVVAKSDTIIYSAEYFSNSEPKEVNIALAVCTFKREQYINRLIDKYEKSSLKGVEIFISDNGKTLKLENIDGVHIFPNKNYGGAGGFTRCMLEVKRHNINYNKQFSHIVLMDDDILLDLRSISRLQLFLSLLKDEYNNYFVCGAMTSLDEPDLQYERNSHYLGGNNFHQLGAGMRLMSHFDCIINEEDDELTHFDKCTAGWWFCCMSTKLFDGNNYPFPCFFRGDDLEYSLRNGSKVITMNGFNVWHEPFYKKYSNTAENYYLPRNALVINMLYMDNPVEQSIKYLNQRLKQCLIQYDYDGIKLLNKAMDDFFEGPDFFINTDAENLNAEVSKFNHKMITFRQALGEYDYGNIVYQANQYSDSSQFVHFIRKITLNGYLIPSFLYKNFRISGVGFRGRSYSYFRRKNVFNADTFNYKGYFTSIDKKLAAKLFLEYRKKIKYYKKNYSKLLEMYSLKFPYLTSEKFWIEYLGIESIR